MSPARPRAICMPSTRARAVRRLSSLALWLCAPRTSTRPSIMHRGGPETHKDPGREVWVYDLDRHARVQKIPMQHDSGSILVSRDAKPLLFSIFIESNILDVYDAASGRHLRAVSDIGTTPTIMK